MPIDIRASHDILFSMARISTAQKTTFPASFINTWKLSPLYTSICVSQNFCRSDSTFFSVSSKVLLTDDFRTIKKLQDKQWWNWPDEKVKDNIDNIINGVV